MSGRRSADNETDREIVASNFEVKAKKFESESELERIRTRRQR